VHKLLQPPELIVVQCGVVAHDNGVTRGVRLYGFHDGMGGGMGSDESASDAQRRARDTAMLTEINTGHKP
jgi:hypothetical protein